MLRVATFNLLSGRSLRDGLVDRDRLAAAVRGLDADVVAVQEVDHGQARSGGRSQVADLAAATGLTHAAFGPTLHGRPGIRRTWRAAEGPPYVVGTDGDPGCGGDGPAYGVGLLSRWPVLAWRVRRFPAARGRLPMLVPGEPVAGSGRPGRPGVVLVPDEPRVALAAVVDAPGGPVTVVSTHLSFMPWASVRQLRAVCRWTATLPGPRLVAGDLNLPGGLATRVSGWADLVVAPTWPSAAPRAQLDHLLGEPGSPLRVHAWDSPAVGVSDHRPLLVDLVR